MNRRGGHARLAARLLPWFERYGRRHLPWQREPTPYRVWISEVMLQQTQVGTVAPYYARFLARFPDAAALAAAPLDAVLHHWSGLGYYARARNLHRAAAAIVARYGGELPATLPELVALPGIGRSTAGAILALAHGLRYPILDGNAKRVLARAFAVRGWPGEAQTAARLWRLAEDCTPRSRVAEYTQAIMDLGATVCTRANPACDRCPLRADCAALAAGCVGKLPARRARAARGLRTTQMLLVVRRSAEVLLERRAARGIWGGLWAPPEFRDAGALRAWCAAAFGSAQGRLRRLPVLHHAFTHCDLDIVPWVLPLHGRVLRVEAPGALWYNCRTPAPVGIATPVRELIGACTGDGAGRRPDAPRRRGSRNGENGSLRAARPRGGRTGAHPVPG